MIRKALARITPLVAAALLLGAQNVSSADRVASYALYGNNGTPTLYAELDVRTVGGVADPNSWFYVTDGETFDASGSCDTVQITKDSDGTVHTTLAGYAYYYDESNGDMSEVYIQEHLTRLPSGASSLSVNIASEFSAKKMLVTQSTAGTPAEIPMVVGTTYFLPGK